MTEEWRQINSFPGVDIRRFYINGEPTDLYIVNGRLGHLTAEWWDSTTTPNNVTRQLYVEGMPCLVYQFDGRAMPEIRGGTTVDKQVGASGDDGGWVSDASFQNTDTWTNIGKSFGKLRHWFSRWTAVTISDTIDVSYVELYGHSVSGSGILMKFYGVDEDNPAAPTSAAECEADPLTSAAVDWDVDFTTGAWNQSPSLNTIFQELVDSYTISNDAVMLQLKDDASPNGALNTCRTYDYTGNTYGAKLHIEYSAAVGQPTAIRTWGVPSGSGYNSGAGKWN